MSRILKFEKYPNPARTGFKYFGTGVESESKKMTLVTPASDRH